MSKTTSHDTSSPSLVPWLLSRFDPYAVRGSDSPQLARQAEDRLREYIHDLQKEAAPGDPRDPV
jgi:hypothetical protein